MNQEEYRLGIVVAGSLAKGMEIRLDSRASIEDVTVGRYVTIEGQKQRFFGMITDISLAVTDPKLTITPPDTSDPFTAEVLVGTSTYGIVHVLPMLTIGSDVSTLLDGPQPVKTVPGHFSAVNIATERDIELVFGKEDEQRFHIGNPLDMETKLCLDLEKLVTRSNGIFGKSGTGKTFLTRILLAGMLQKSKAVNLIFDMHNEYGWEGSSESGYKVQALKQLFPEKVAVFTLDEENSRHRGVSVDCVVRIGYDEIVPEDMVLLRQTLNLTEPAVEAVYQLRKRFGRNWLKNTLQLKDSGTERDELLKEMNIHESTFQNLQRGLATIARLPFIQEAARDAEGPSDAVNSVLEKLDRGINVVLEFGRHRDITSYLLVANMLTRRIYARYQERTEKAMGENSEPPRPLVITIEEAHKFLNPEVAGRTIFGTIAREMRKYNATLLVIDQRPSSIDEEIMSQMGTKITCLLDNERDIDSVLAGTPGKNELKAVLSRLAPKQQALIFGHAVPMPVPFQPREWGSAASYGDYMTGGYGKLREQPTKYIEELWD